MTDKDNQRDPVGESAEAHPDDGQVEEADASEPHLLSRGEILAAPDDDGAGDEDDEPYHGLTVGELAANMPKLPQSSLAAMMASMPKLPKTSLFRSPALDFVQMQDKLRGTSLKTLEMPEIEPMPERAEVRLQRGILREQETQNEVLVTQNEVLVTLLQEAKHSGRQTTWTLRFTAFSAVIAIVALGIAVYFGTRPTTAAAPTPLPSPSITRSATP